LLRNMGGTPREILNYPEMLAFLLPVIRADFRLAEDYNWDGRSKCSCPFLVLGGTEDTYTSVEELNAWAKHTTAETNVLRLNGGHFFISSQEAEVCRAISAYMYQHL
jgi:surfactin synthase thioesterase subunit